ncbi:hypothetical protein A3K72_03885 [Candidatus Woesearchaeota archaeon RBG_13_36_6]|nr:MAG: hypothetical protein A3K72_03885 [Candidatus Woesearchaeota archaeon RBG_13_36_6]
MVKKAQFATEYMIVSAFALIVISFTVYAIYSQLGHQTKALESAELSKFGNSIIDAANKLGYMGEQSRTTLNLVLPQNVKNAYVENGKDIVFEYEGSGGSGDMVFHSNINLALDFDDLKPGLKNIVLESKKDYILICSKTDDLSCDNICETEEGENTYTSPGDCCKRDCTGCSLSGDFNFCETDNKCHAACANHNECNAQCDWNTSLLYEEICYNCTLSCLWGNQKSCPRFCVNETQSVCGSSSTNHTIDLDEYCNYGANCLLTGCLYTSSANLTINYCYSCTSSGAIKGDYCPLPGTYNNTLCYYGDNWNCTGQNLLNCTLNITNLTTGYPYYSLVNGNPSWRLNATIEPYCEWGSTPCNSSGVALNNSELCYPAGQADNYNTCYYDASGDTDRSNDCSTTGCTLSRVPCSDCCNATRGCVLCP